MPTSADHIALNSLNELRGCFTPAGGSKMPPPSFEKKRRADSKNTASEPAEIFPSADSGDDRTRQRVFRVNHHESRKPMTLDEALLEMEEDRDYLVYRDADKECVSVLVRRRDGHFDLIES